MSAGDRRQNDVYQERVMIPFSHGSVSADTTVKLWTVPSGRSLRIDRVWYNNPTGLAQDATNIFNIKITDGTNISHNWSTLTGAQGTLTANTPVDLVASATDSNMVLTETEVLTLFLDLSGTQTLPAGVGMVEGRLL